VLIDLVYPPYLESNAPDAVVDTTDRNLLALNDA